MRIKQALIILIFLGSLFSSALAIGITPSSIRIPYVPGEVHELTFHAINNINVTSVFDTLVEGELSQYITLDTQQMEVLPGELKSFHATLRLPEDLKPGPHETLI